MGLKKNDFLIYPWRNDENLHKCDTSVS